MIKLKLIINLFKIPKMLFNKDKKIIYNNEIKEALAFNKNLLIENFILPNRLGFPLSPKYFRKLLLLMETEHSQKINIKDHNLENYSLIRYFCHCVGYYWRLENGWINCRN